MRAARRAARCEAVCARTGTPLLRPSGHNARETDCAARMDRTRRLIAENGVTYNVYADPTGHATGPGSSTRSPLVHRAGRMARHR